MTTAEPPCANAISPATLPSDRQKRSIAAAARLSSPDMPTLPDRFVIELLDGTAFDRRQRFVNVGNARTCNHALHRNPAVSLAQPGKDSVLDAVQRRKIDMAALGRLHMIAAIAAPDMGDAQSRARSDNADGTGFRQRLVRAGQVEEMLCACLRHGVTDCAEIIDDDESCRRPASRTPASGG